jgi:CBS domain-containing protein
MANESTNETAKQGRPLASVGAGVTVFEAVRVMVDGRVGAIVIQEGTRLLGIFTERDVVRRVVLRGLDPKTTPVSEVMTKSVVTVREDADRSSLLRLMSEHYIRHLPVVDVEGRPLAILSMRHLLRAEVQDLQQTVWELVGGDAADGPGG